MDSPPSRLKELPKFNVCLLSTNSEKINGAREISFLIIMDKTEWKWKDGNIKL